MSANGTYSGLELGAVNGSYSGVNSGVGNGAFLNDRNLILNNLNRNGLVLYLDASSKMSYQGTGTSWNDLSWNNRVGVLTNGPTFNESNGGSIVFDGNNDFVEFGDILDLGTNSLTVNIWTYINSVSTGQTFLSKALLGAQNFRYSVGTGGPSNDRLTAFMQGNGGTDIAPYGSTSLPINTWFMSTFIFDRTSNIRIYYNGVRETLTNSATISQWTGLDFQSINPFRVGSYTGANNVTPVQSTNGRIASVIVYFRAITEDEIFKIYKNTKAKFNT
jgi:hypothetical protein